MKAEDEIKELDKVIESKDALIRQLYEALYEAARSLATISRDAGRTELMDDISNIRGYANSRAIVAETALKQPREKRGD